MEEILIRSANESDLPDISAIERACFSVPWSDASLLREISNPISVFLTARIGEALCGYVSAQTVAGECYIGNVAVDPSFRRRGVAEKLLSVLIGRMRSAGFEFVTLEVRVSNVPAVRLYEKLGFVPVGYRKNYYSAPVEDAALYTLFFTESEKES